MTIKTGKRYRETDEGRNTEMTTRTATLRKENIKIVSVVRATERKYHHDPCRENYYHGRISDPVSINITTSMTGKVAASTIPYRYHRPSHYDP